MIRCKTNLNNQTMNWVAEVSLKKKACVRMRKILTVFLGLLGLWCIFGNGIDCWNEIINRNTINLFYVVMMLYGVALIVLVFNLKPFQKAMMKRNTKKVYPFFFSGTVEYVFDADGIQVQSWMGEGKYKWKAFKEYGMTDEYFYVIRCDDRIIIGDKNSLSKEEVQELRQLLENNIANEK